jgi:putative methionine-R-sulfoxide reductase with GAF domain
VLLNRAIDLICDELGFYHAQVFLVDDIGINAVLAHSRGEVGRKLLEQGHKIPVGSASVVGTVAASRKPVIVNDTVSTEKVPHLANPLLPQTRAELGLPLITGGTVIGCSTFKAAAQQFPQRRLPTYELLPTSLPSR